jgi:hypothetical protein
MLEREALIARIRHLRRTVMASDAPAAGTDAPGPGRIDAIEVRLEHLERLVEGFQDSVYRESERVAKRLAELEARIQPSAINEALSKDARERGL